MSAILFIAIAFVAGLTLGMFLFPRKVYRVEYRNARLFKVVNKNREINSNKEYLAFKAKHPNAKTSTLFMFTEYELKVAKVRADKNKDELRNANE